MNYNFESNQIFIIYFIVLIGLDYKKIYYYLLEYNIFVLINLVGLYLIFKKVSFKIQLTIDYNHTP